MEFIENRRRAAGLITLLLLAGVTFTAARPSRRAAQEPQAPVAGMVFTMSNQLSGNMVYAYTRNADGTLKFLDSLPTRGSGSGADLNSQGALLVVPSRNMLYVPNANPISQTIAEFSYSPTGLTFMGSVGSNGASPASLTVFGSTVYVLNQTLNQGSGTIVGFTIGSNGLLSAIPGATGFLSGIRNSAPAEVAFNPSGTQIVVTERKAANDIDVFPVNPDGTVGPALVQASHGSGPFGFAFDSKDFLDVAEGGMLPNGLSSYLIQSTGTLSVVSGSVPDHGSESAHVVVASPPSLGGPSEVVYVSNAISDTISLYSVKSNGAVSLLSGTAAALPKQSKAIDMCLDSSGSYLYILTQKAGTITGYRINEGGSLTQITSVSGLPTSATWGLAGY